MSGLPKRTRHLKRKVQDLSVLRQQLPENAEFDQTRKQTIGDIVSSIKIVPVKDSDIQSIHALAESWVLSNLDDPSHGFLVSNFTLDEYRSFLAEDNIFVKAEVD